MPREPARQKPSPWTLWGVLRILAPLALAVYCGVSHRELAARTGPTVAVEVFANVACTTRPERSWCRRTVSFGVAAYSLTDVFAPMMGKHVTEDGLADGNETHGFVDEAATKQKRWNVSKAVLARVTVARLTEKLCDRTTAPIWSNAE